jgi:hypothetical protein
MILEIIFSVDILMIVSSSCRNIDIKIIKSYRKNIDPLPGNVLLAEVADLGFYDEIEDKFGKLRKLSLKSKILVVQGNRYSTQAYEIACSNSSLILGNLGGVVGKKIGSHEEIKKDTKLKIIGYAIGADNAPVNLRDLSIKRSNPSFAPKIIVVVGSDMDIGKTTCVAFLARAIKNKKKSVNFGKLTGTARLKDLLKVKKAGAGRVLDFTDCGFASTYKVRRSDLSNIIDKLHGELSADNPDYIIFEVADGILQRETKMIIEKKLLNRFSSEVIFCCRDALAAGVAKKILGKAGLSISFVSGIVANSELGIQEVEDNFQIECKNTRL